MSTDLSIPWFPPWEAAFGGLAGLALLSFGVVVHAQFGPHGRSMEALLNEPLAWTLLGATPLFAALGWVVGDRRRERELAIAHWEQTTTQGMKNLAQREWLTRGILQTALDAMLVIDDNEDIVDANPPAARIFGLPLTALIGTPVIQLLPAHKTLGTTMAITRRTAGGEVLGKEWQTHAVHADGSRFPVDLNIVALRGPNLLFYAIREATTRVKAERRMVQEARSAWEEQSEAHRRQRGAQLLDLGSALRGEVDRVIRQLDTLRDAGTSDPDLTDASYTLLTHLERLQALSVWERSDASVSVTPVPVQAMVDAVVHAVEPLARHRRNRIVVRCDPGLGEIHTDALRITAALRVLIANAATHTHEGIVTVDVRREPGRGTDWLTAQITDTGPGLDVEALDRIYQLFAGPPDDLSITPGGGLGLKLAHRLARTLGGHISVSSSPDGTTFMLRLPLDPDATSLEDQRPRLLRLDSEG